MSQVTEELKFLEQALTTIQNTKPVFAIAVLAFYQHLRITTLVMAPKNRFPF